MQIHIILYSKLRYKNMDILEYVINDYYYIENKKLIAKFNYKNIKNLKSINNLSIINDDLECAICLNKFDNENFNDDKNCCDKLNQFICYKFNNIQKNCNELYKLSCSHIYHKKCILEWLKKDKSCPICRDTNINFD
jgi:hypothetical protein